MPSSGQNMAIALKLTKIVVTSRAGSARDKAPMLSRGALAVKGCWGEAVFFSGVAR